MGCGDDLVIRQKLNCSFVGCRPTAYSSFGWNLPADVNDFIASNLFALTRAK